MRFERFELEKIIGHRGACGHAPENTLVSMSKAHELGARWVEFDVIIAGYGGPIIMHDFTLERTTDGQGEVSQAGYDYLSSLDCGSWFSKHYVGLKIPTLDEILQHISALDLGINIEIKSHPGKERYSTQQTLESLRKCWPSTCQVPLISSFSTEVLQIVRELTSDYRIGYIIDNWHNGWQQTLESLECASLHVDHRILTRARVLDIKAMGRYVLAFTVNDVAIAKQLFDWGVDSVFTDYPDQILTLF